MLIRIVSPKLFVSPRKLVPFFFILCGFISGCTVVPISSPVELTQTAIAGMYTPVSPLLEITPSQTGGTETMEFFSSDQLGLCFSYPQGHIQIPYNDIVQIEGPDLPGSEMKGRFWLEISDSNNLTAEEIADQEMEYVAGLSVDRWSVTLGGEEALVLDGMPGQDLVRRVYIVHEQTLYILTFSPTRSENAPASDQMESLYDAVTSSWAWSLCSPKE